MHDKYRGWPLPTQSGNVFPVFQGQGIQEQVLKDLADTDDNIDKLEILDSFSAYVQRFYQQQVAVYLSCRIAEFASTLLEPVILSNLIQVNIPHRGRPSPKEK